MYVGTVLLRRTEKEFWRMTPRKLNALSKVHGEVQQSQNSTRGSGTPSNTKGGASTQGPVQGFIDQIL